MCSSSSTTKMRRGGVVMRARDYLPKPAVEDTAPHGQDETRRGLDPRARGQADLEPLPAHPDLPRAFRRVVPAPEDLPLSVAAEGLERGGDHGQSGTMLLRVLAHRDHPYLEPQVRSGAEVLRPLVEARGPVEVPVDEQRRTQAAGHGSAAVGPGGRLDGAVEGEAHHEASLVEGRVDLLDLR